MTTQEQTQLETVHALFVKNIGLIKGFVMGMCPDISQADDIVQEVFSTVSKKAQEYRPDGNFLAWVRAMARFKVMEHRRKMAKMPVLLDDNTLESLAESAEESPDIWEQYLLAVRECLQHITTRARKLIDMRYSDGCSPTEIAQAMSRSAGSVNVELARLRQALRACANRRLAKGGI